MFWSNVQSKDIYNGITDLTVPGTAGDIEDADPLGKGIQVGTDLFMPSSLTVFCRDKRKSPLARGDQVDRKVLPNSCWRKIRNKAKSRCAP